MSDNRLISLCIADYFRIAFENNNIRKEFVVVQDMPVNGKTVETTLNEYGIKNVEIIKIGDVGI